MSNVLTESVDWFYPELAEQLEIDHKLGFLAVDAQLNFLVVQHPHRHAETTIVGFSDQMPGEEQRVAHSITELDKLPVRLQKADRQAKGVGARLYNVPEALSGTQENPDVVHAYAVALDRIEVLDLRHKWHRSRIGQVALMGRHAARLAESKVLGLPHLTERLHAAFERANPHVKAVIQPLPPRSDLRRAIRGYGANPVLDPSFLLIRDPNLGIQRVGSYTRPGISHR